MEVQNSRILNQTLTRANNPSNNKGTLKLTKLNQELTNKINTSYGLNETTTDTAHTPLGKAILAVSNDFPIQLNNINEQSSDLEIIHGVGQQIQDQLKQGALDDSHQNLAQSMYHLLRTARDSNCNKSELFTTENRSRYQYDQSGNVIGENRQSENTKTAWTSFFKDCLTYSDIQTQKIACVASNFDF